jgi:O-antigen/teichoic acid export membrane protein
MYGAGGQYVTRRATAPIQWIKTNFVILINAGSLISTTAVTSVLGFAYWWIAARSFSPETVGLASAAISAMMLLGTVCILGLGTLLIGELPRQPGKEGPLISAALIVVGAAGGCAGVVFALVAPFVAADFQVLRAGIEDILLFAIGVSLTAITLVLDQALIGLLRGGLRLWRNTIFSVAKLAALFAVSLWLSHAMGLTIYATWAVGNAVSVAALAGFAILKRSGFRSTYWPEWGLLRKLRSAALQHHMLNLTLQAPTLALPVLVTILLSATTNAWFYVAWTIASFVFAVPIALTTVLYATVSGRPAVLAHKTRLTLGLASGTCVLAACVLLLGTKQVLGLFGHIYAEEAAWSLRILALGALPLIIKNHYTTLCRIQDRIRSTMLPMVAGTLIELGAAALGARFGGLSGLSLGWVAALCAEAAFMSRTVFMAVRPREISTNVDQPHL